jgi:hypothetical protein
MVQYDKNQCIKEIPSLYPTAQSVYVLGKDMTVLSSRKNMAALLMRILSAGVRKNKKRTVKMEWLPFPVQFKQPDLL